MSVIETAKYSSANLPIGIVHLGLGRFHRAHQAHYVHELLNNRFGSWGICGVSLQSSSAVDTLKQARGAYHLEMADRQGRSVVRIESLREALFAPHEGKALLERLSSNQTKIISLTVTEKGYCHDSATGELNEAHPDIAHDLTSERPRSAIGWIVRGLQERRKQNGGPVNILSCDNLSSNGLLLEHLVKSFARRACPSELSWIEDNTAFPCSMVDRIVPATTSEQFLSFHNRFGFGDLSYVATERFSQWVIENRFITERPALEEVGVEFVKSVEPFEEMKLRLLNGSHSLLAYLGQIAGFKTVDAAANSVDMQKIIQGLWREVGVTLKMPGNYKVDDYCARLLQRFRNPHLKHRLEQIATDGSQKITQRWLPPLYERLSSGERSPHLTLALAAWMFYYWSGAREGTYKVNDPMATDIAIDVVGWDSPLEIVTAFLQIRRIFSQDLSDEKGLMNDLQNYFALLQEYGAEAVPLLVKELTRQQTSPK